MRETLLMMTRDEMIAKRNAEWRAAQMAKRADVKPEITATRTAQGVRMVITNPTPDMRESMNHVGFELVEDFANRYAVVCPTPESLQVVQDAMRGFFGR